MILPVIVEPPAEQDLKAAFEWYENQVPGLGHEFLVSIRSCFGRLERTPEIYSAIHDKLRRARVERFPFGVFYLAGDEAIYVLAIMHHSKDPKYWQKRFKGWSGS